MRRRFASAGWSSRPPSFKPSSTRSSSPTAAALGSNSTRSPTSWPAASWTAICAACEPATAAAATRSSRRSPKRSHKPPSAASPPGCISPSSCPTASTSKQSARRPTSGASRSKRWPTYEIDRLISRTLSYAILTGLLAGTFIGLIALSTDALALSGRVGVAASTLAAAALFNPLRVRVQRLVDRRFNRARYDAAATVAAFTARLRDAIELDTIRGDLLEAVNRAVEPTHASVWIKP